LYNALTQTKIFNVVGSTERAVYAYDDPSNDIIFGPMKGIDGASEYAVYGWAKWTHPPAGA